MVALTTTAEASAPADHVIAVARALGAIGSLADLQTALAAAPLNRLLPSRDICVLRATHGSWEAVIGPEDGAERVNEYSWSALVVQGKTVGMLGIGAPGPGRIAKPLADAVTSLLALTLQHLLALEALRQQSVRDGLTGCFNRAHAMEVLEGNLRRANRTGFPVSILMIDLDDFKRINDRYGHVAGDAVLEAVAGQLHGMLRRSDVRCRLGGDEFLVVLPDTPPDDAVRVAESVRYAIERLSIPSSRGRLGVTASIGVATAVCGAPVDVPGFIDRADVALYRAKQAGRNAVHACTPPAARQPHTTLRLMVS